MANKGIKAANVKAAVNKKNNKQGESLYRLDYYDTELENLHEYGGFSDLLQTFELRRGKGLESVEDVIDDKKRISGYFKGSFRIYKNPMPKGFEKPDPIYGTFKGLPSNEPTKVIVRVYRMLTKKLKV